MKSETSCNRESFKIVNCSKNPHISKYISRFISIFASVLFCEQSFKIVIKISSHPEHVDTS